MVAELTEELDVMALLAESVEFIRECEYSKNLLDDLLNNDDLLDDLQRDSAAVATVGIIPLEFANQDNNSWYLEGDVIVKEAKYATLVQTEPKEKKFRKWTKAGYLRLFVSSLM